jgi:hypothetical protein
MSYWDNNYPRMPSFWMSLRIVSTGILLAWLTRTDWYDLRRSLREAFSALWWVLVWFLVWLMMISTCLLAPVAIPVYMIIVRRQQRRVMIKNRKQFLRDRLRVAVKGYSWG